MKKATKKEILKHENRVMKASQLLTLNSAYRNIDKCSIEKYLASGITITIKNINKQNNVICEEFIINDGLSPETIEAIKKDIERSYDLIINHPINTPLTKKLSNN